MLYPRDVLSKIHRALVREEFIILTGARQVGKTSLLILLKEHLEKLGQPCHYLNLENPIYLKALNEHPFNIFDLIPSHKAKVNIFVDEVQYLDNPTNFLKLLYDEKRREVKIIASGSSAFYISDKFKDSLAGRKFLFEVFPLNFDEFLVFNKQAELLKQKKEKLSLYYRNKLLNLWVKYLTYGGYPKVALAEDDDLRQILLEEIGTSYIKKDVNEAGIKNTDKYFALLRILAEQTGQLVNSQELSGTLGLAHKTIKEYLQVMKKSYQVALIKPFFKNLRKELTKMSKVYFFDGGLRNFLLNNYAPPEQRPDKGAYLENAVFKELLKETNRIDKIRFWRTQDKHEVDFVVGGRAWEIKFDRKKQKAGVYDQFIKSYPEIEFKFLSYEDFLGQFYGWEI